MQDMDGTDLPPDAIYLPKSSLLTLPASCLATTIQSALEFAREDDDGVVCTRITIYLENQLDTVINKLQAAPTSYLLDKDEFALFNYFRYRYEDADFTRSAISRFWNTYSTPKVELELDQT